MESNPFHSRLPIIRRRVYSMTGYAANKGRYRQHRAQSRGATLLRLRRRFLGHFCGLATTRQRENPKGSVREAVCVPLRVPLSGIAVNVQSRLNSVSSGHHGRPNHHSESRDYPQHGVDPPRSDVVAIGEHGKDVSGSNGVHRRVLPRTIPEGDLLCKEPPVITSIIWVSSTSTA